MPSNLWRVELLIEDTITGPVKYDAQSLAIDIRIGVLANTAGLEIKELKAGLVESKVTEVTEDS